MRDKVCVCVCVHEREEIESNYIGFLLSFGLCLVRNQWKGMSKRLLSHQVNDSTHNDQLGRKRERTDRSQSSTLNPSIGTSTTFLTHLKNKWIFKADLPNAINDCVYCDVIRFESKLHWLLNLGYYYLNYLKNTTYYSKGMCQRHVVTRLKGPFTRPHWTCDGPQSYLIFED